MFSSLCRKTEKERLADNQQETLFTLMPNRCGFRPGDQCDADSQWWVWSTNALLCTITVTRDWLSFCLPFYEYSLPLLFCVILCLMFFYLGQFCADHWWVPGFDVLKWRFQSNHTLAVGLHSNSWEEMPLSSSVLECLHLRAMSHLTLYR